MPGAALRAIWATAMGRLVTIHGSYGLWIWEVGHHSWDFRSVDMGNSLIPYPQTFLWSVDMGIVFPDYRFPTDYIYGLLVASAMSIFMVYVDGIRVPSKCSMVYVYGSRLFVLALLLF